MDYNFSEIEQKWQKAWEDAEAYKVNNNSDKPHAIFRLASPPLPFEDDTCSRVCANGKTPADPS